MRAYSLSKMKTISLMTLLVVLVVATLTDGQISSNVQV